AESLDLQHFHGDSLRRDRRAHLGGGSRTGRRRLSRGTEALTASVKRTIPQPPKSQATRFRLADFALRFSSAIPDSTTGARSGNSATSDRFPPITSTVFRSVDSSRSLRFSSRDTLSCVIPSFLAIRTCVSLRAWRNSRSVISSAISSPARASTFLRRAGLSR